MDFSKPCPGDPLNIPASTYGAMVDAAAAHRQQRRPPRGGSKASPKNTSVILVQNKTGEVLARYACVEVYRPVVLPSDNEAEFHLRVILQVIKPTANKLCWGILQEPLPADAIGQAVFDGITIATINLAAATDKCVDSDEGETVPLSGVSGSAQIAWVAGGVGSATETGEQLAVIRITGATLQIACSLDE